MDQKHISGLPFGNIVTSLDCVGAKCLSVMATFLSEFPQAVLIEYMRIRKNYSRVSGQIRKKFGGAFLPARLSSSTNDQRNPAIAQPKIVKRLFSDNEGYNTDNAPSMRDPYNVLPTATERIVDVKLADSVEDETLDSVGFSEELNNYNSLAEMIASAELMVRAVGDAEDKLKYFSGREISSDFHDFPSSISKIDANLHREINEGILSELQSCLPKLLSYILLQNISKITPKTASTSIDSQVRSIKLMLCNGIYINTPNELLSFRCNMRL